MGTKRNTQKGDKMERGGGGGLKMKLLKPTKQQRKKIEKAKQGMREPHRETINISILVRACIFLHPVVCVCCIRDPVGIQTLQTSNHLPSWLLANAAWWSQDGVQSHTRSKDSHPKLRVKKGMFHYISRHTDFQKPTYTIDKLFDIGACSGKINLVTAFRWI